MTIAPIAPEIFRKDSLDAFVRAQKATEPRRFTGSRSPARKREKNKPSLCGQHALGALGATDRVPALAEKEPCEPHLVCDVNGGAPCKA